MTLLATEIHNHDNPANALIVFAADRRISLKRKYYDKRKKIFELRRLNAGIGYFGLAVVGKQSMQDWLQAFLAGATGCQTMAELAERLADSLNRVIPPHQHRIDRSGFHIAGYNKAGHPEFWYVRNVDDNAELTLGRYEVREDFQRRDARTLTPNAVGVYRNGDLRAHEAAWQKLDDSFGLLLNTPGFKQRRTATDYISWVKFKMELICYFYKIYYQGSIIARPVDAFGIKAPSAENRRSRFIQPPANQSRSKR
jgi:hypothetical protein